MSHAGTALTTSSRPPAGREESSGSFPRRKTRATARPRQALFEGSSNLQLNGGKYSAVQGSQFDGQIQLVFHMPSPSPAGPREMTRHRTEHERPQSMQTSESSFEGSVESDDVHHEVEGNTPRGSPSHPSPSNSAQSAPSTNEPASAYQGNRNGTTSSTIVAWEGEFRLDAVDELTQRISNGLKAKHQELLSRELEVQQRENDLKVRESNIIDIEARISSMQASLTFRERALAQSMSDLLRREETFQMEQRAIATSASVATFNSGYSRPMRADDSPPTSSRRTASASDRPPVTFNLSGGTSTPAVTLVGAQAPTHVPPSSPPSRRPLPSPRSINGTPLSPDAPPLLTSERLRHHIHPPGLNFPPTPPTTPSLAPSPTIRRPLPRVRLQPRNQTTTTAQGQTSSVTRRSPLTSLTVGQSGMKGPYTPPPVYSETPDPTSSSFPPVQVTATPESSKSTLSLNIEGVDYPLSSAPPSSHPPELRAPSGVRRGTMEWNQPQRATDSETNATQMTLSISETVEVLVYVGMDGNINESFEVLCFKVSQNSLCAAEAARAITKELMSSRGPQWTIRLSRTIQLFGMLLQRCTFEFPRECASDRVLIQLLESMLCSDETDIAIKGQLLDIISAAAYMSSLVPHYLDGFATLWRKVMPPDGPIDGEPLMNGALDEHLTQELFRVRSS